MAYMSQENKAKLLPGIKKVLADFGVKATLSVDNHSTLICTIQSSTLDFFGAIKTDEQNRNSVRYSAERGHFQVNTYWIHEHFVDGDAKNFLMALKAAMNVGNWDKSDAMSDYFNVGWYISINIGRYNKPYVQVK